MQLLARYESMDGCPEFLLRIEDFELDLCDACVHILRRTVRLVPGNVEVPFFPPVINRQRALIHILTGRDEEYTERQRHEWHHLGLPGTLSCNEVYLRVLRGTKSPRREV